MKKFSYKIFSKNKESINSFDTYLFEKEKIKKNFKLIKKPNFFCTKNKKITLLAAPHIDKDAQEHFNFSIFKKSYFFLTTNFKKFLTWIKKIKSSRFSDVKSILTFQIEKNDPSNRLSNSNYFYLDNFFFIEKNYFFSLEKNYFYFPFKYSSSISFLKVLDISGETILFYQTKINFV